MSLQSFSISPGASGIAQTHCDDNWKWGSIDDQYYSAGSTHGYCTGSGHRAVFRIKIPSSATSPTGKGYLIFNFNGVVGSSGSRTVYYGITTSAPPSPGSSAGSIPNFIAGTSGSITYSGLTTQNKQLSLTIGSSSNLFSIPSAGNYIYLWLYNNSGSSMECYSGASYYSATLYAEMVGAPSAPTSVTITSTSSTSALSYIKPTQTVRVRWSGAAAGTGGSITGYKIWYRPSNSSSANSVEVSSSSTSGYKDISISGYTSGITLIVSVGTKGTGDLWSGNTRASNAPTVNAPPELTTASFNSTAIISGRTATITLSGHPGKNSNGNNEDQTLSFRYSTSASGTKYSVSNGSSFSFTHTGNDSGTYGRYFYAYDGLEYSSYKYASITVHSELSASLNSSQYETSTSLNGIKYLKKGIFKINTNKTTLSSSNITATVGEETATIADFSRNSTLITVTIDFTELTTVTDLYTSGKTIPIKFTINAGTYGGITNSKDISTSFTTGNSGEGIVFSSTNASTLKTFSLGTDYAKGDISNYNGLFNNNITLKSDKFNSIKNLAFSIDVDRFISSNGSTYTKSKDLNYQSDNDDVSSLDRGIKVKYKVTITDPNGNIYSLETSNILTRVQEPQIQENTDSVIENTSLDTIYFPTSETISVDGQSETIIQIPKTNIYINGVMLSASSYPDPKKDKWLAKFNNEKELIIKSFKIDNSYIYLKFDTTEIISKAKSSSLNKNSYHDASLSISFIDDFGLQSDYYIKQSILKIDFRERPKITSFKIYHSKRMNYDGDYLEVTSNNNTQKVNPEEYIKFSITVTDDNAKNGVESYNNFTYIIKRKDLDINAGTYTEIARGYLNASGSKDVLIKTASVYSEIKKYKYEVEVIDTSNLSISSLTNLSTEYDLICFPTNSSPESNITTTFDKNGTFTISLGDNLCGYDGYSSYLNLERGEYEKDFKIAVFSNTDYNAILNLSNNIWNEDNTNNKLFTEWEDENGNKNIVGYKETKKITRAPSENSTTYYRIGLKISTGLKAAGGTTKNYIYTWSQIYSIDPNNPVVSIRKNYLGINTGNVIDTDDTILLQINSLSSGNRKIIKLYGPDTTSPVIIEIDLDKGTIDGAIIDGGTWENLTP